MFRLYIYFFILFTLLGSCNTAENDKNPTIGDTVVPIVSTGAEIEPIDTQKQLNDIADFIAGKNVRKESSFYTLSQTDTWRHYSAESEYAWKGFEKVAKKYQAFSEKNIKAPYDTIKTLFYPFSGPDFLFANIMFPNVEHMILMGLESPGSIPAFDKAAQDSLNKISELYRVAIEDVVQLSFFRTVDMKNELGNKAIDGTTPILMLFLARSDKEIMKVQKSYFSDKGIAVETNDSQKANAVVIEYRDKGSNKIKKITYLSLNLADPTLKKNRPVMAFLKNIDQHMVTFIKSATYLMHKPYFSIVRNICLNKSVLILQDDSGIAYHYFKKEKWNFHYFGSYTKPIDMFNMFYQEDYFQAFKQIKTEALHFRAGYNRNSNLLLALKK